MLICLRKFSQFVDLVFSFLLASLVIERALTSVIMTGELLKLEIFGFSKLASSNILLCILIKKWKMPCHFWMESESIPNLIKLVFTEVGIEFN